VERQCVDELMRREPKRRRAGLTLIEVMIALSILAVGLLTLSSMQLQALRAGRGGKTDTIATTIAQDKMEDLRRKPWTHADLSPTGNWTAAQTLTSGVDGQTYQLDWRVTDVVANWTRSIDVRVRWNDPKHPNRLRTFSSLRYNREEL
jgi:type IV pilus assembly protein PilV